MPDHGAPALAGDADLVILDDAAVRMREIRYQLGVAVAPRAHALDARLIEPVRAEHREHRLGGVAGARGSHRVRRQVFALRRPELRTVSLAEPRGIAGMVRMVVREDDSPHGFLLEDSL